MLVYLCQNCIKEHLCCDRRGLLGNQSRETRGDHFRGFQPNLWETSFILCCSSRIPTDGRALGKGRQVYQDCFTLWTFTEKDSCWCLRSLLPLAGKNHLKQRWEDELRVIPGKSQWTLFQKKKYIWGLKRINNLKIFLRTWTFILGNPYSVQLITSH